nr:hypothetical protein [Tanacetum cinerariifolium]
VVVVGGQGGGGVRGDGEIIEIEARGPARYLAQLKADAARQADSKGRGLQRSAGGDDRSPHLGPVVTAAGLGLGPELPGAAGVAAVDGVLHRDERRAAGQGIGEIPIACRKRDGARGVVGLRARLEKFSRVLRCATGGVQR